MTYQECKRKTYHDNVLPDRKIFVKSRDINFIVVIISKKLPLLKCNLAQFIYVHPTKL